MPPYKQLAKPRSPSEEELERFRKEKRLKTLSVRIPEALEEEITRLFKETGKTKADLLREMLNSGMIQVKRKLGESNPSYVYTDQSKQTEVEAAREKQR